MIPAWCRNFHNLHRNWSRHLYRLPPLMFRSGYGKPYGYTYIQLKPFSTYTDNFTSSILKTTENKYGTHFLYQYRQTRTLVYQGDNNDGEHTDDKTKKKHDDKNSSGGGAGCGDVASSGGEKSSFSEGGWFGS